MDVSGYATQIDAGMVTVSFGGYLSDYNGSDRPEFKVEFYNASNSLLGSSATFGNQTSDWTFMNETEAVPGETETVRLVLMGTRNAGSDNDSYFDEMFVRLNLNGESCEQYTAVGIEDSYLNQGVHIYPNPVSDIASIEVIKPNRNGTYQLQLFDQTGRLVHSDQSLSGKFTVRSSQLASGLYLYQISEENWSTSGKLVIQ